MEQNRTGDGYLIRFRITSQNDGWSYMEAETETAPCLPLLSPQTGSPRLYR